MKNTSISMQHKSKNDLWEELRSLGEIDSLIAFIKELQLLHKSALIRSNDKNHSNNSNDISIRDRGNTDEISTLTVSAIHALKTVALAQEPFPHEFQHIVRYVLPICLSGHAHSITRPSKRITYSNYDKHEVREILADWLNSRAYSGHASLRRDVLHSLCRLLSDKFLDSLRADPFGADHLRPELKSISKRRGISSAKACATCWTISAIGLATIEVNDTLKLVAAHEETADVAFTCLAALGNAPHLDATLKRLFHDCLEDSARQRRLRQWMRYPVSQWVEPADFPLLLEVFSTPPEPDSELNRSKSTRAPVSVRKQLFADLEDASWILADIAERYPDHLEWQDEIWRLLLDWHTNVPSLGSSLFLGSGLAPRINADKIAPDFLSQLLPTTEVKSHHRSLVYMRLEECILPSHIEGLLAFVSQFGFNTIWQLLQEDALLQTDQFQYNMCTPEMTIKRGAWRLIFNSGTFDGFSEIENALRGEQNGGTQAFIIKKAAFFRLPTIPHTVQQLVEEVIDLKGNLHSDDFVARLAAQRLVASQGTFDALQLLLQFGLTWDGQVMEETANAVTQLAVEAARSGEKEAVIALLLETAFEDKDVIPSYRRSIAIAALRELSIYALLPPQTGWKIAQAISKHHFNLSSWKIGQLIETVGLSLHRHNGSSIEEAAVPLSSEKLKFVEAWFWSFVETNHFDDDAAASDEPKWRAISALIHSGLWQHATVTLERRQLFYNALNLVVEDRTPSQEIRIRQINQIDESGAFVLGLLYLESPDIFEQTLLNIIESEDERHDNSSRRIGHLLSRQKRTQRPSSSLIGNALCHRAAKIQSDYYSHPYWFTLLRNYSAHAMVLFSWEDYLPHWNATARGALSDSVALAASQLHSRQEKSRAEALALLFVKDGAFSVRRGAYRTLRDLKDEAGKSALTKMLVLWSGENISVELRKRGAEAIGWSKQIELHQPFLHDPEKCVRDVAHKSLKAERRRELADLYLDKVLSAARSTIISDGEITESSTKNLANSVENELEFSKRNNSAILQALPYGDGLIRIGEDDHIEELRLFSTTHRLPSHVFYWLEFVMTNIEKQWKKTVKKWPKPWDDIYREL